MLWVEPQRHGRTGPPLRMALAIASVAAAGRGDRVGSSERGAGDRDEGRRAMTCMYRVR